VQQSLPLRCRGDFPVSWGEHVSRGLAKWWWALVALVWVTCGLAKWPNRGRPWALDPCPSLLCRSLSLESSSSLDSQHRFRLGALSAELIAIHFFCRSCSACSAFKTSRNFLRSVLFPIARVTVTLARVVRVRLHWLALRSFRQSTVPLPGLTLDSHWPKTFRHRNRHRQFLRNAERQSSACILASHFGPPIAARSRSKAIA
jgi:hypothetical protein